MNSRERKAAHELKHTPIEELARMFGHGTALPDEAEQDDQPDDDGEDE